MNDISNEELHEATIRELAVVLGEDVAALKKRIEEADGDLEIKSTQGQAVASRIEVRVLDVEDLIRPEDQKTENLTTISSLERLIRTRIKERRAKEEK